MDLRGYIGLHRKDAFIVNDADLESAREITLKGTGSGQNHKKIDDFILPYQNEHIIM